MLAFKLNLNAAPFMEQVQKLVLSGNVDRAVKLCGAAPNAALSRVIRAGLTRANRGEQEVARALEESVLEVTPLVAKRIQPLWSLANVATLVGLIEKSALFGDASLMRMANLYANVAQVDPSGFEGDANGFNVHHLRELLRGFCNHAGVTMHVRVLSGTETHHVCEAVVKAWALSLRKAVAVVSDTLPSTKGVL